MCSLLTQQKALSKMREFSSLGETSSLTVLCPKSLRDVVCSLSPARVNGNVPLILHQEHQHLAKKINIEFVSTLFDVIELGCQQDTRTFGLVVLDVEAFLVESKSRFETKKNLAEFLACLGFFNAEYLLVGAKAYFAAKHASIFKNSFTRRNLLLNVPSKDKVLFSWRVYKEGQNEQVGDENQVELV